MASAKHGRLPSAFGRRRVDLLIRRTLERIRTIVDLSSSYRGSPSGRERLVMYERELQAR